MYYVISRFQYFVYLLEDVPLWSTARESVSGGSEGCEKHMEWGGGHTGPGLRSIGK